MAAASDLVASGDESSAMKCSRAIDRMYDRHDSGLPSTSNHRDDILSNHSDSAHSKLTSREVANAKFHSIRLQLSRIAQNLITAREEASHHAWAITRMASLGWELTLGVSIVLAQIALITFASLLGRFLGFSWEGGEEEKRRSRTRPRSKETDIETRSERLTTSNRVTSSSSMSGFPISSVLTNSSSTWITPRPRLAVKRVSFSIPSAAQSHPSSISPTLQESPTSILQLNGNHSASAPSAPVISLKEDEHTKPAVKEIGLLRDLHSSDMSRNSSVNSSNSIMPTPPGTPLPISLEMEIAIGSLGGADRDTTHENRKPIVEKGEKQLVVPTSISNNLTVNEGGPTVPQKSHIMQQPTISGSEHEQVNYKIANPSTVKSLLPKDGNDYLVSDRDSTERKEPSIAPAQVTTSIQAKQGTQEDSSLVNLGSADDTGDDGVSKTLNRTIAPGEEDDKVYKKIDGEQGLQAAVLAVASSSSTVHPVPLAAPPALPPIDESSGTSASGEATRAEVENRMSPNGQYEEEIILLGKDIGVHQSSNSDQKEHQNRISPRKSHSREDSGVAGLSVASSIRNKEDFNSFGPLVASSTHSSSSSASSPQFKDFLTLPDATQVLVADSSNGSRQLHSAPSNSTIHTQTPGGTKGENLRVKPKSGSHILEHLPSEQTPPISNEVKQHVDKKAKEVSTVNHLQEIKPIDTRRWSSHVSSTPLFSGHPKTKSDSSPKNTSSKIPLKSNRVVSSTATSNQQAQSPPQPNTTHRRSASDSNIAIPPQLGGLHSQSLSGKRASLIVKALLTGHSPRKALRDAELAAASSAAYLGLGIESSTDPSTATTYGSGSKMVNKTPQAKPTQTRKSLDGTSPLALSSDSSQTAASGFAPSSAVLESSGNYAAATSKDIKKAGVTQTGSNYGSPKSKKSASKMSN